MTDNSNSNPQSNKIYNKRYKTETSLRVAQSPSFQASLQQCLWYGYIAKLIVLYIYVTKSYLGIPKLSHGIIISVVVRPKKAV